MKLYSEYKFASISMSKDANFKNMVSQILKTKTVKSILESGTFNGLGSTTMLAEIVKSNSITLNHFYTLEVEEYIFKQAVSNLKPFNFVKPIWGMSLSKQDCLNFIEKDEAINNHENYAEVFIDSLINPKEFYTNEIKGNLSHKAVHTKSMKDKIVSFFGPRFTEDCFEKYIPLIKNDNPIILLDSAGGVGFLEFQTVLKLMGNKPYYLILDDVHHLKHFRSLKHIKNNSAFEILEQNLEQGWVVSKVNAI